MIIRLFRFYLLFVDELTVYLKLKYVWDSGQGTEKTGDPDKNGYGVSVKTAICRTSDADKRHNEELRRMVDYTSATAWEWYNIHISRIKLNSKHKLLTEWTSYFRCLYGVDLTLVALKRVLILCGTPEMQRLMDWCSAQYSAYTLAHAAYSGKSIADPPTSMDRRLV